MIILHLIPFIAALTLYISNASSLGKQFPHFNDDLESLGAPKDAFCDDYIFSNICDAITIIHNQTNEAISRLK